MPQSTSYDEETDYRNRVNFKATDFIHQPRYRAKAKTDFINKTFLDNFYVGIHGGINGMINRVAPAMDAGMQFGISAAKYFNPWSGLRLSLDYSNMRRSTDQEQLSTLGLSIDHIFNLSSYISGFDPYRRWEILTIEGIGLSNSKIAGESAMAFDAHLGLQFKVNTGSRLDLYIEPRINIYSDGIDVSGKQNWHRYDIGYGALLGATYRLGTPYYKSHDRSSENAFLSRSFFDFSSGVQTLLSQTTKGMGFRRALGNSGSIGFGTWISESLAFRLAVFAAYNGWKPTNSKYYDQMAAYGGGRIELMLDPVAIVTGDKDHYQFSVQPFAGVELGCALKQDSQIRKTSYLGFTGGLRLKQRLSNEMAVFIEPRYSFVPYSYYHKTFYGKNLKYNYADHLLSVNLGVEFSQGRLPEKISRNEGDFTPHFTFSTSAGAAFPMQQLRTNNRRVGYMGGLGFGYWFNSVSGLRVNAETGTIVTRQPDELRQILTSGSIVYTFNLTNLINGYDPERKWSGELFAGPVLAATNMRVPTGNIFHIGAEGGGRLSYHVDELLEFYLEPKYRLFMTRVLPVKSSGTPLMAEFSVGTTYHFAHRGKPLNNGEGILGNTFVGMSIGGINSLTGVGKLFKGEERNFMNSSGPVMSIYIGKWLKPWWGLRFGAMGSFYSNTLRTRNQYDKMTAYLAATAEAMLNPFNFGEREFKVELLPIAGFQVGRYWREMPTDGIVQRGNYTALTAALQVRFNISESFAITLEPKGTRMITNAGSANGMIPLNENMLSLSLGLEMNRPTNETLQQLRSEDKKFRPHAFASIGIGGASQIAPQRYNNLNMGITAEIVAGWQFTPYSAASIGVDYAKIKPKRRNIKDGATSLTTIAIDYAWDMSNSFMGYDPKRKAGVELFAGPLLSIGGVDSKVYPGFELGGRAYLKLSKDFDIHMQPRVRFYGRNYLPASYGQTSPMMFTVSIGTTYRF